MLLLPEPEEPPGGILQEEGTVSREVVNNNVGMVAIILPNETNRKWIDYSNVLQFGIVAYVAMLRAPRNGGAKCMDHGSVCAAVE